MQIEDTMAQVANSSILQSMPSLKDYMLGFELIDSDQQNNKGIGVCVARLTDTYIFIPAIYKNGRLYDLDMLYVPEYDQFLPAQDNTISYLKAHKPGVDYSSVKRPGLGYGGRAGGAAKVTLILPFTQFSKVASDPNADLRDILKTAGSLMGEVLLAYANDNGFGFNESNLSLPQPQEIAKHASAPLAARLLGDLQYPEIHNAFAQFYDETAMKSLVDTLNENAKVDARNTPEVTYTDPVKLLTSASTEARGLSDLDKAELLRDGAIIKDNRGYEPSLVYKAKQNADWQTPDNNGMYELLKSDGSTLTAYVINMNHAKGFTVTEMKKPEFIVIPADDAMERKAYTIDFAPVGQAYPADKPIPPGGTDCTKLGSLDVDYSVEYYVFTTPRGDAVACKPDSSRGLNEASFHAVNGDELSFTGVTLRLAEVAMTDDDTYGTGDNITHLDGNLNTELTIRTMPSTATASQRERITKITIGKPNSKIVVRGNTLRVPEGTKVYKCTNRWDDAMNNQLDLVDQAGLVDAVIARDNLQGVYVFKNAELVGLSDRMSKHASYYKPIDAQFRLVKDYAISPADAKIMVKEASNAGNGEVIEYLVKIADAAGFGMIMGDEQPATVDYFETSNPDSHAMRNIDDDRKLINSAVDSGVKSVMDISVLKIMAQDSSSVREIQRQLPNLMASIDSLGRMLYLCRAGDSMVEAYGDTRADVMERKLKRLFQDLWDLVLSLQQGRVDDFQDLLEGQMSSSLG